ncbi:hypothetical protein J4228_04435 [Candidatus Woesearchaeota archaeon]|nr:hypothetical protein [Candidatus Woesearchaeota archaeon]
MVTMKKEVIILGDIEMGAGTLTDDFISDTTLSRLIISLVKKKHPVDLILNGDTFDFLKCPYITKQGKKTYPRHISQDISLGKLGLIFQAHQRVFDALHEFAAATKNRLFFTIGNHDHDLFYKGIQHEIRKRLKSRGNVYFGLQYKEHGIYAEHGQQYDAINRINPQNYAFIHKGRKHLNLPWVSFAVISGFTGLKEEHPFLERIRPIPLLFSVHQEAKKKLSAHSLRYFLKSVFYYPFRYFMDPTYSFPRSLFHEFYRRLRNMHWDIDGVVNVFKKKKKKLIQKHKIFVFGHIHKKYLEEKGGTVIIHPDTWRDEYILDERTKKLIPKLKHYVQILVKDNGELQWSLQPVSIQRSSWNFADVAQNERAFIRLAAKEEEFIPVKM